MESVDLLCFQFPQSEHLLKHAARQPKEYSHDNEPVYDL